MTDLAGGENELLVTVVTLLGTPVIVGVDASMTGAGGGGPGVTGFDAADSGPVPTLLVALTVNV
jgi:hypothetical protein